jgi:4-hydroxybenzoate polyprenyltransferase
MLYLKSICVGLAFVLGSLYAISFLMGIVLLFVAKPQGQDTVGFSISLHSPMFWLPSLLIFVTGFFWAYRRFSK